MVDAAKEVGADAVSHGCTGKGNDQVCFRATLAMLKFLLKHDCWFFMQLSLIVGTVMSLILCRRSDLSSPSLLLTLSSMLLLLGGNGK